jgi:hypothetical protein
VVERQHGVRFAAAERGLQPDDRITTLPGQPLDRALQHLPQAAGDVSDAVELARIAVGLGALAAGHSREVGGELGLLEPSGHHVRMRRRHVAPRLPRVFAIGEVECLLWRGRDCLSCHLGRDAHGLGHRLGLVVEQRLDAGGRLGVDRLDHGLDRAEVGACIGVSDRVAGVRHVVARGESERDVVAHDQLEPVTERALPVVNHGLQQRIGVERLR